MENSLFLELLLNHSSNFTQSPVALAIIQTLHTRNRFCYNSPKFDCFSIDLNISDSVDGVRPWLRQRGIRRLVSTGSPSAGRHHHGRN